MLSKFSVRKPYTVLVGVVLAIVLGAVSFTSMTIDLLPSMDLPYAIVITSYNGANPETVEMAVTKPIEQSMATISNVVNITSTSSENMSMVMMEFSEAANMDSATLDIRESLDQIKSYWPDDIGNPMIMKINPNMMPIMVAALGTEGGDATENSQWLEQEILPEIESVEGVASVTVTGSIEQSVEITLNPDKIAATNEKIQEALDGTFVDAQVELDDAKSEIESGIDGVDDGVKELASQTEELLTAKAELESQQTALVKAHEDAINAAYAEIDKEIAAQQEAATPMIEQLMTQVEVLAAQIIQLESIPEEQRTPEQQQQLDAAMAQVEQLTAQLEQLSGISGMTEQAKTEAKAAIDAQFAPMHQQIADGLAQMEAGATALEAASITASVEMAVAKSGLTSALQQVEQGQEQLDEGKETALEAADAEEILTADMVNQLISAQNFSMPAGYVNEDGVDYLVRIGEKFADLEEVQNAPLMDMDIEGLDTITLDDVADVKFTTNVDEVYGQLNGLPALMLNIQKQTGYSTGDVSRNVNEKFAELEGDYEGDGLQIVNLMDQGVYIDLIISSVIDNMIYGAILAIIILLLFLRSIRPTFVIACSIPISVVIALVLMYFSGITLNIISMSGLALGIGMLVDNSIVVIENIYRMRQEEGASAKVAAIEGARQVSGAIMASTLTTACVFLPIVFVEGITRQLFVDMGLTIAYSLLASLIIALTFVPAMSAGILKKEQKQEAKLFVIIQDGYAKILGVALRFKLGVIILAVVALAASGVLALQNGLEFMGEMESNQISVTLETDSTFTMEETAVEADKFSENLLAIEDISDVGAMIGTNMFTGQVSDSSQVTIYAILNETRTTNNAQLQEQIEVAATDIQGEVTVNMSQMDMGALSGDGISVKIQGKELDTLREVADSVAEIVEGVEGTTEVSNGMEDSGEELRVIVDKGLATKEGLTVAQVFAEINGELAQTNSMNTLTTDADDYTINVVDGSQEELTREDIKNIEIEVTKQDGTKEMVPLEEIATFEDALGLQSISREDQVRTLNVTAAIAEGYNITQVAAKVTAALEGYEAPNGYSYEMAGEDEMIMNSMVDLVYMLLLGVLFMYLIMVAQFQSLLSPFIIMFTIPLAFTGGLLALWMTGSTISIIAMIGFVMLSGIIVNNGIVLVDYTNQLRLMGIDKKDAIIQAGKTRLRPIVMTALTTILALVTMAMGVGMGSDMVQPMAIVTIGGLIYGTLLTLFVIPCMYDIFNRKKWKKEIERTREIEELQELEEIDEIEEM